MADNIPDRRPLCITKQDRLYILRSTEQKLFDMLFEAKDIVEINNCLSLIGQTRTMVEAVYFGNADAFSDKELCPETKTETAAEEQKTDEITDPAACIVDKVEDLKADSEPVTEPAPTPAPEKPKEKDMTLFMEVRKKLATSNADIASIFAQLGVSKFSKVPQEMYPQLLEMAGVN